MALESYTKNLLKPSDQIEHPIVKKIRSFLELENGWYYGRGVAPNQQSVNRAIELHNTMLEYGLIKTDAFPGEDGEIQLNLYYKEHYLEFILEHDGSVTFARELGELEKEFEENMRLTEAKQKIREFWKTCDLSEYSTPATMIRINEDSQVLHSATQLETVGFRLWNQVVPPEPAILYAST